MLYNRLDGHLEVLPDNIVEVETKVSCFDFKLDLSERAQLCSIVNEIEFQRKQTSWSKSLENKTFAHFKDNFESGRSRNVEYVISERKVA